MPIRSKKEDQRIISILSKCNQQRYISAENQLRFTKYDLIPDKKVSDNLSIYVS